MTIISIHKERHIGNRRCDASCYNAKHDKCSCICDGMNHGAGENYAIEYTARHHKKLIDKLKKEIKDIKAFDSSLIKLKKLFGTNYQLGIFGD